MNYEDVKDSLHISLWLNLRFLENTEPIPDAYIEILKRKKEARKKNGIKAPMVFVYRESFLPEENNEYELHKSKIEEIKNLGIKIVDYDELVKLKISDKEGDFYQSAITKLYTKNFIKKAEGGIKGVHPSAIIGYRADIIDIIKLELLYNLDHLKEFAAVSKKKDCNGALIEDFDLEIDYSKADAVIENPQSELLFVYDSDNKRQENSLIYTDKSKGKAVFDLIKSSEKLYQHPNFKIPFMAERDQIDIQITELMQAAGIGEIGEKKKIFRNHMIPEVTREEKVYCVIKQAKSLSTLSSDQLKSFDSHRSWYYDSVSVALRDAQIEKNASQAER